MIRQFLLAIFLAGIFSALSYPVYNRLRQSLRGRRRLAAMLTVLLLVFVILIPLAGFLGIVTAQAVKVGAAVTPWVERQVSQPETASRLLKHIPFYERIEPYRNQILGRVGELVAGMSRFLLDRAASITFGTVNFLLMTLIMLYTIFFFLVDGDKLLTKILYYLPLRDQDERRMLEKFTSVTRATIKGTLVIGIVQGTLAGLAFAVVGIPSAVFWGTVMTVLSIIPGIGSALVWVPSAIVLAVTGHITKALGLAVFCAAVVGSLDNILRPILVGKDTRMHELLIFFGTLGGLLMFGIFGFIIGPIIAALFVTLLDLYATAFQDMLPPVKEALPDEIEKTRPDEIAAGEDTA